MRKAGIIIIATALFVIIELFLFTHFQIDIVTLSRPSAAAQDLSKNELNVLLNSYYRWKSFPLFTALGRLVQPALPHPQTAPYIVFLAVFFCGLFALFISAAPGRLLGAFILSALLCAAFPAIFLLDSMVFQSIAFFPLFFFSARRILERTDFFGFILFLAATYLLLNSAAQVAIFYIIITTAFLFITGDKRWDKTGKRFLLAAMLIASVLTLTSPAPDMPNYPNLAHVVPDDNLPGNIVPLLGRYPTIPFVNRDILKRFFLWPAAAFFISTFIAFLLTRKEITSARAGRLLLFLAGIILADVLFGEALASIAPVAVMNRVIPGLFFYPLTPLFLAAGLVLLSLTLFKSRSESYAALLILIIGAANLINPNLEGVINVSSSGLTTPRANPTEEKDSISVSPSYNVIYEAQGYLPGIELYEAATFSKLRLSEIKEITSSHPESAARYGNMLDGDLGTRWSPQSGQQNGDEWLRLSFDQVEEIKGIYMKTGMFPADFPRAVEIVYAQSCESGAGRADIDFSRIYYTPRWEGPIKYTTDGFPYYDGQSEVLIIFVRPVQASCIEVRQVGKAPLDWSVAELRIAR